VPPTAVPPGNDASYGPVGQPALLNSTSPCDASESPLRIRNMSCTGTVDASTRLQPGAQLGTGHGLDDRRGRPRAPRSVSGSDGDPEGPERGATTKRAALSHTETGRPSFERREGATREPEGPGEAGRRERARE